MRSESLNGGIRGEIADLALHRINPEQKDASSRFILAHGGRWLPLPEGDDEGAKWWIMFPSGTICEQDRDYWDRHHRRYLITFSDDAYFFWYQARVENEGQNWEVSNTVVIPRQD